LLSDVKMVKLKILSYFLRKFRSALNGMYYVVVMHGLECGWYFQFYGSVSKYLQLMMELESHVFDGSLLHLTFAFLRLKF